MNRSNALARRPSTYALYAAALFALQALFPIVHRLAGGQYHGYTHAFSAVVDVVLAALWIAAAVAGVVRRSGLALAVMCVAAAATHVHGFLLSVSTSSHGPYGVGIPFLVASGLEAFFLAQATPAFRREAADEPSALDRLRGALHRRAHAH